MARLSEFDIEGMEELLVQFDDLAIKAPKAAKAGVEKAAKRLETAIKNNIRSYGLEKTGALLDSVGYSVTIKGNAAIGSAGVFHMPDKVNAAHGLTNKDISRAMLAYWFEHGIQAHSTASGSKVGSKKRGQNTINHPGVAPKPFVSSAYEQNIAQIQQDYADGFNFYSGG